MTISTKLSKSVNLSKTTQTKQVKMLKITLTMKNLTTIGSLSPRIVVTWTQSNSLIFTITRMERLSMSLEWGGLSLPFTRETIWWKPSVKLWETRTFSCSTPLTIAMSGSARKTSLKFSACWRERICTTSAQSWMTLSGTSRRGKVQPWRVSLMNSYMIRRGWPFSLRFLPL